MLFSLVPFISFNVAECLGVFWRRSKLVIMIKHFWGAVFVQLNGEGVSGRVGVGLRVVVTAV